MRPRFGVDLGVVVAAAFVVVASFAFSVGTAGWIGFGVFAGLLVAALGAQAFDHGAIARTSHGLLAAVAIWAIVASLVFAGSALMWLLVADAIALGTIAVADLVAHELSTERVVHTFEVSSEARSTDRAAAGLAV